jgi:hypothetical protein
MSARSIADQAVLVLEQEPAPLYLHDLQRGIERELGRQTYWGSVSAVVGSDRRFCWSGKGMYALFRHGRIPGVRSLADIGAFVLVAAEQPLSANEIGFLLSWSGYRFQQTSLEAALGRERRFIMSWKSQTMLSTAGWKATLADHAGERRRLDDISLPLPQNVDAVGPRHVSGDRGAQRSWPVDELIKRWRANVRDGLIERLQRLSRARSAERERQREE